MTDAELLSAAIVVWTGWGRTSWPARDERFVAEAFGAEHAAVLLAEIRQLEDDFYSSDARFISEDLGEMGKRAAVQFRSRHPELAEEAVRALAWCYTYDYK
jgi:hypothetical protein